MGLSLFCGHLETIWVTSFITEAAMGRHKERRTMIQNLATPVLHNVTDAITHGVAPEEFIAAMHRNPQGDVWRNAEGALLHDCGNCGRPRETNGDCECQPNQ